MKYTLGTGAKNYYPQDENRKPKHDLNQQGLTKTKGICAEYRFFGGKVRGAILAYYDSMVFTAKEICRETSLEKFLRENLPLFLMSHSLARIYHKSEIKLIFPV